MMRSVRRLVFVWTLVFASCIRYVPKPIDVAESARALQARTLDVPGDLTVDSLTAAAMRFNPDIAVARAGYQTALAAIGTASERPNPTVNASVQRKNSDPGVLSPWISNFGIDVPLEFPSKRRARVEQARENAYSALAHVGWVAWQTRSRIRSLLITIYAAGERQAILEREIAIQKDIVEVFTKRVALGEAAQPELSRARIALGQTTMLMHDARRLAAEARARVAGAVGVPLYALGDRPILASLNAAEFDEGARDAALRARPDVIAALHDYAAADASLRLEIARQYPDLHLQPAFGWDQGTRTWLIGGAAEIPLMNRHRGPITEGVARRDEAAARFLALQLSIIEAFDVARASLAASAVKIGDADRLLAEEQAQLETVRRQFEAGEIDRLALRSAELELDAARLARLDAAAELDSARAAVEDVVQQPLTGEIR